LSRQLGKKRWSLLPWIVAAVVLAIFLFKSPPTLVPVPDLNRRIAQDQAEELLKSNRLVPHPNHVTTNEWPPFTVVPFSQIPPAGTPVKPGTSVFYDVAGTLVDHPPQPPQVDHPPQEVSVRILEPSTGRTIRCARDS